MNILLLAGSGEARRLAKHLTCKGHRVTASLAGATRDVEQYACQTRVGGFGGNQGFADYLTAQKPDLVIDATHPFARQISERSLRICLTIDIPYLQLLRPEWTPLPDDIWHMVSHPAEARAHISPGSVVFLATGRQTLKSFANLGDCRLICRQIDPPDGLFPFTNGDFLVGRPPFSVEDETTLFKDLGVDVLVVKNAGGTASRSKLEAARLLQIPVVMIERPPRPDAPIVETVEAALDWVNDHAHH